MAKSKLGLGGHSFIEQLGNDPMASYEEQCAIVSACLDTGIQLIDTTYFQERVALGEVLQQLGRRNEAEIMDWNFFKQSGKENSLVVYTPYENHHLDIMIFLSYMLIEIKIDGVKNWSWLNAGKWRERSKRSV